jgi:hypothetical protein
MLAFVDISDETPMTHSFNGTKAAEFAFQVGFFYIITETRDEENFVRVTTSMRVILGIDYERKKKPFC